MSKKGAVLPAEWSEHRDAITGARVVQVTSHASINHPSYFLQSSFLPGDKAIFFTSYRTGDAQLFEASLVDGTLRQLTDGPAIHPFSPLFHEARNEWIFTRGGSLWALRRDGLEERQITRIERAQFGEPSLSANGEWLTAAFKGSMMQGLIVAKVDGSGTHIIPFPRTVIHPQFHPLKNDWIEFAGDPAPRMHRVRLDGSGLECLYDHGNDEFVVHETFLGQTGDLAFTVWPYRLCRMDWSTREITTVLERNAWHIAPNRSGACVLYDTNHPDRGIEIVEVESGVVRPVCQSQASGGGSQWKTSRYALAADFESARSAAQKNLSWMEAGTDTVYGPQWTHPHPSWSRDETQIAFASDRTGHPQVYVAAIP